MSLERLIRALINQQMNEVELVKLNDSIEYDILCELYELMYAPHEITKSKRDNTKLLKCLSVGEETAYVQQATVFFEVLNAIKGKVFSKAYIILRNGILSNHKPLESAKVTYGDYEDMLKCLSQWDIVISTLMQVMLKMLCLENSQIIQDRLYSAYVSVIFREISMKFSEGLVLTQIWLKVVLIAYFELEAYHLDQELKPQVAYYQMSVLDRMMAFLERDRIASVLDVEKAIYAEVSIVESKLEEYAYQWRFRKAKELLDEVVQCAVSNQDFEKAYNYMSLLAKQYEGQKLPIY